MQTHNINMQNNTIGGEKISYTGGKLKVPTHPIIPFIEGDGVGKDITPAMQQVIDTAVACAYDHARQIHWMEIYAGGKSVAVYGENQWLTEDTFKAIRDYHVAIKGPLMTPIGGGIRSLNVALRQQLDLYICLRPIQYFPGVPSPVKHPELIDMVIFRENTEDIYAGIEWPSDSDDAQKLIAFLKNEMHTTKIRFDTDCGIGIKPVSKQGSQRLIRSAVQYAIDNHRKSVTLVHKGNIQKFTEGAFKQWGYDLCTDEFGAKQCDGFMEITHPQTGETIQIKDMIADAFLQDILLHPSQHDVIATLNLNGDYISDALAAQVGGIGIAPGANIGDGTAIFEATHGTAPNIAGKNIANPCSIILSGAMMLRHLGWNEAADLIIKAVGQAIQNKTVTADFADEIPGAHAESTSEFTQTLISLISKK